MGRKSLAEIRSEEILRAFERCIIKYGLDVSLEQIAAETGVRRSIIRHYIGNRDELIEALIEHITKTYLQEVRTRFAQIGRARDETALLEYLFDFDEDYDDWDRVIIDVLVTAKERYPKAKKILQEMFGEVIRLLAHALTAIYPAAMPEQCRHIAYTLFCLVTTHETMLWVGFSQARDTALCESAKVLLKTLK